MRVPRHIAEVPASVNSSPGRITTRYETRLHTKGRPIHARTDTPRVHVRVPPYPFTAPAVRPFTT